MSKNIILNTFVIIFMSLLFVSQNLAIENVKKAKNIGKFISISETGTEENNLGPSVARIEENGVGTKIKIEDPHKKGRKKVIEVWAGVFNGTLDGNSAKFYCIDLEHNLAKNEDYADNGKTPIEITYILNNYYPYNSYPSAGAASIEEEAAAIQAVIWHYSDEVKLDKIKNNDNVKNRALAIYNDVEENASSVVYPDYFSITPPFKSLSDGETANFEIKAFDSDGNPFAGLAVNLATSSGILSSTQVVTNANGVVAFTLDQDEDNLATITAAAQITIPQGTKYVYAMDPEGKQKLVLATPTVASGSASANVFWGTTGSTGTVTNLCAIDNDNEQHTLAQMSVSELTNGNINVKVSYVKTFNDNTYDKDKNPLYVIGWPANNHTFDHLLKSDKLVLSFTDGNNNEVLNFAIDYLDDQQPTLSGYGTRIESGDSPYILNHNSSLSRNFNDFGYVLTDHSPASDTSYTPDPAYPYWIYDMYYEVTIDAAAFNGNGFGDVTVADLHNSPSKLNFDNSVTPFDCGPPVEECENTIGHKIWHDSNLNGIQDDGIESGIGGVIVDLYDSNSSFLSFATTDNTGYYEFTQLANGIYTIKIADENFEKNGVFEGSLSENWYLTNKEQGENRVVDSNGDENMSATVVVDCNDDFTIDFGFFHTCMSFEKTGPQSIESGEVINYNFKVSNCGDVVLAGGASVFDAMINPIGDHFIRNGTVQPGDDWEFSASYSTTKSDCGDLNNIANAIGHPVMPNGTALGNLETSDNWTVEVVCNPKATLGDRVWFDNNNNGIQDFGEDGVEGVTVNLYNCLDVFVATISTNEDGYYLFENLEVGNYYVQFVLPNNYLFSPQNEGTDVETDSDADENTGKTTCTDLVAGEVDLSWDAGIYTQAEDNFDLTIEKTASNTNPEDEEIITYTITVTNNGTVDGTSIIISDVLQAGLIYQSSSPAGYDATTGVWTVGNLAAGISKSLNISVKVDYSNVSEAPIFDLGIAAPYNLFVLKDATHTSDTEGKVAVGRNATFSGYSIGDKLPLSGGTEDVLIVGRKLTYTNGQVFSGNIVYGKYLDVHQVNLCSDGSIRKEFPVPVDFAQAKIELNALSNQLETRPVTGTTIVESYGIVLTGQEPTLNVFEINGSDLSAANSVVINVPNGSVVLININGKNISWFGGLEVNGTGVGNVLYNFYQAKNIHINGIEIRGSVLAPKAKVIFEGGFINGQMICNYFDGHPGQVNLSLFHGSINGNTEITNCAEIIFTDQIEGNTENNISCAPIVVNVDFDPNNGNNTPDAEWVEYGGNTLNEMIWSMYQNNNGLIVGTVGGNIYSHDGNKFTLLNEGMKVTYIWSLYEFNGHLYAGTELGLFKYDGSSWNKAAIDGDVRSITSIDNTLFAAVWGGGVFASNDNGVTWIGMNAGLEMSGLSVHALTVADGELYAGTFGLGVLRYDFTNNNWVELPLDYKFVWSLATDVDGTIYAGTYGGGAYISNNYGESWTLINSGLPNKYIYSISIYGNDVYISTWSAGVYKFELGSLGKATSGTPSVASSAITGQWASIGMGGIEVSSIMVDETTNTLYAGTSSGAIYKMKDSVTGVDENNIAPTKFKLEQNYPNPFNPSTTIKYSIPVQTLRATSQHVKLVVYDILGREVATLVNKDQKPGNYEVTFDASKLTSSVYFYKLVGNNVNITKKMMLLK